MFSWSHSSRKGSNANRYPAQQQQQQPVVVAQTIQGTIRPPDFTRQQHLESYCHDDILKRSTRKVSTGE